jgi:polyisoprenoid-binding protein YceI
MTTFQGQAVIVRGVLALAIAAAALRSDAATRALTIDPGWSRATIAVGKGGALSFAAGHTHEVVAPTISGVINLDAVDLAASRVRLTIDAAALRVTGKGEPAKDIPEIQRVMLSDKVLDVGRYPTITFESTGVTVDKRDGTAVDASIAGQLTLHGVTRSMNLPVHIELTTTHDALTARGQLRVKQTDYGMTPVTAAGVVKVKDMVDVDFLIVADARSGG